MELLNQDKIRTLAENKTYKYLGILEAETIKQLQMKQNLSRGFAEYMFQEKREEKDKPALKTVGTHRYNNSKTIYKNTMED